MAVAMNRVRGLLRTRRGRLFLPVALCAIPAGLEAGLVVYLGGLSGTTYIAPRASALSPYGAFHDVRWVMVYHQSWASAGESLAAVLVRGLLWVFAVPAAVLFPSTHWRRVAVTPIVAATVIGLTFVAGDITSPGAPKPSANSTYMARWSTARPPAGG